MGVTTNFTRVQPEVVARVRRKPELINILWNAGYEDASPLGLTKAPESTHIDKSWDDMLCALDGAGEGRAYKALSGAKQINDTGDLWARAYTVAQVRTAAAAFAKVDLAAVRKTCLEQKVHGYFEEFTEHSIDYPLGHFDRLRKFFAEAAKAEQAIVACSA